MTDPDPGRRSFLGHGHPSEIGKAMVNNMKNRVRRTVDGLKPLADLDREVDDTGLEDGEPSPDLPVQQDSWRAGPPKRPMVPLVRPPGAIEEEQFLAQCTRCNDCATACPHDAIIQAPDAFADAAGTPMIIAKSAPCLMCEDTPCISACEPAVLLLRPPLVLGTARVLDYACISSAEEPCTVCSDECPIEEVMQLVDGRPELDAEHCTGCGICQHVCPAPRNAIMIKPLMYRQPLPS